MVGGLLMQFSLHSQAENDTEEVYVDLAFAVGGASWALRILRNSSLEANQDIQDSFTSAFAQVKLNEIRASVQSCRRLVTFPTSFFGDIPCVRGWHVVLHNLCLWQVYLCC
jgi:hypothetical protein